ncbi:MAG: VTT domain-containing protein [Betaproteobacteria bacterium]
MSQLISWIEHYGLYAVFLNVMLETIGLPVPAYPMLIVAGALIAQGHHTFAQLLACAVAAALIADLVWYMMGARYGGKVLRVLCRVSLSPDSCVRQTESIFSRWGSSSLVLAKFIPGFATVATALSGILRIRLAAFLFFDLLGATLWAGVAVGVGYIFRDAIGDVIEVLDRLGRGGVMVLLALFALFVIVKWWQRKRFYKALRMARISVSDLRALLDGGVAPRIIDVRPRDSQERDGRIPGATTLQKVDAGALALVAELRDAEVIVYCACPNEASAALVAKQLMLHGVKRVRPLHGGIEAWIAAGFAVER